MGIDTSDVDDIVTLSVPHPGLAPTLQGKAFVTAWFRMDSERSDLFEKATYMDQYVHPYGGGAGYGEDLVEGFHLLGMLDFLVNQALWSEGPWIAWNYGLDSVRFVSVIRWTDSFRIRGVVDDVVDRGDQGHLMVLNMVGEVRGRERPGFVAVQRVLWATNEA